MAARKRIARKPAIRCGFIEERYIDRGWVCCACFNAKGIGTYNGTSRDKCKMCGHDRCDGAMDRQWDPPGIVPIAVDGTDAGSFLQSLARGLAGTAMRRGKQTEIPAEWQKACNEVISAFSAAEVHAKFVEGQEFVTPPEVIAERLKSLLPRAMELFNAAHEPGDPPCSCRHSTLLLLAAQDEAQGTGKSVDDLMRSGRNVLDWYLKTVS
jgi:hypothetical protein